LRVQVHGTLDPDVNYKRLLCGRFFVRVLFCSNSTINYCNNKTDMSRERYYVNSS